MAKMLLVEYVKYPSQFYPTHVVGKDNNPINIYIGVAPILQENSIGLYVSDKDFDRIDHKKPYIFIHNPDLTKDEIIEIDWEKIKKNVHIFKK